MTHGTANQRGMNTRIYLAAGLLGLSLCAGVAHAANATADQAAAFEEALAMYQDCKWSAAYGRFAALADRGHPDAARIAMFMLRYGARLYGSAWTASGWQIEQWNEATGLKLARLEPYSGD